MTRYSAAVITVSTRAAAGIYEDRSGPVLVNGLRSLGFEVPGPIVVPDGPEVSAALAETLAADPAVVLTSGGTGLTSSDRTPELTTPFLDLLLPGLAEALRADAITHGIPMGMVSRGVSGVAGRTVIVNIAGSVGAARDAIRVLGPVLAHAVDQIRGDGDHRLSAH